MIHEAALTFLFGAVTAVSGFGLGMTYGSRLKTDLVAIESRIIVAVKAEVAKLVADKTAVADDILKF